MKRIGMSIILLCLGAVAFSLSAAELKYLEGNAYLQGRKYETAVREEP